MELEMTDTTDNGLLKAAIDQLALNGVTVADVGRQFRELLGHDRCKQAAIAAAENRSGLSDVLQVAPIARTKEAAWWTPLLAVAGVGTRVGAGLGSVLALAGLASLGVGGYVVGAAANKMLGPDETDVRKEIQKSQLQLLRQSTDKVNTDTRTDEYLRRHAKNKRTRAATSDSTWGSGGGPGGPLLQLP